MRIKKNISVSCTFASDPLASAVLLNISNLSLKSQFKAIFNIYCTLLIQLRTKSPSSVPEGGLSFTVSSIAVLMSFQSRQQLHVPQVG